MSKLNYFAYVVAVGNPFDGIELYGPFKTREEVEAWTQTIDFPNWDVVRVYAVKETDDEANQEPGTA
jgi:hypothetical protein